MKIITIIKFTCENYGNNINNYFSQKSLDGDVMNKLLKICQYKSNEEIIENMDNNQKINLDKYLNFKIKIAKICSKILIQKTIEILKRYRDDEKKSGNMPLNKERIKDLFDLLNSLKNLELFPNINWLDIEEDEEKEKENLNIFDLLSKTKKMHLIYLQPILYDFIYTKEEEIKDIVKTIFEEIEKLMEIPNFNDFYK